MIRNYKINKKLEFADQYTIRCLDKNAKIWEYLRKFRSERYCESILKKEIANDSKNFKIIHKKASQISTTISQAEEYYKLATVSSNSIKPLILYYGMVGLTKCLILLGDNEYTLESYNIKNKEHETHGLSFKPEKISKMDCKDREGNTLTKEYCYIKNSNFGLYSLLRNCFSDNIIPDSTKVTIKQLLSVFSESQKDYFDYFTEPPNSWLCDTNFGIKQTNDTFQRILFNGYDTVYYKQKKPCTFENIIKKCFPEIKTLYNKREGSENDYTTKNNCSSIDDHIVISETLSGTKYALRKIITGFNLCDLEIHFLLMFILSNLVRYRQDKWFNILNRTFNDQFFLVETFLEVSQIKFPWLILREMDSKNYRFIGEVSLWG